MNQTDHKTPISELKKTVSQFVDQRQWHQFHSPKNLSMALAIEAAELMEHFQWLTVDESREVVGDGEKMQAVGEELADVFCYVLAVANELGIDLTLALNAKMKKNAIKYPVEEYRGRFGADDRRQPIKD